MKTLKLIKNTSFALALAFSATALASCTESQATPNEAAAILFSPMTETHDCMEALDEIVEEAEITLDRSAFCTGIEKHEPLGESETFSNVVGRVYLFTKILMEKGTNSHIRHVWFYNDKEYSNVRLAVKGPSFRTHSYKTIPNTMTGTWKVEVQTDEGQLISTLNVEVENGPSEGGI